MSLYALNASSHISQDITLDPQKIYRDPATLNIEVLHEVLSRFVSMNTTYNMMLVNKKWKRVFRVETFITNVLRNHPFLNKSPSHNLKSAYIKDIQTLKNIRENRYRLTEIKAIPPTKIKWINSIQSFGNNLLFLSNDKLFKINLNVGYTSFCSSESIEAFKVYNDKIFATDKKHIFQIDENGSTTKLFDTKKNFFGPRILFFECLDDDFLIATYKKIRIFKDHGSAMASASIPNNLYSPFTRLNMPRICSLMIFNNTIAVGTSWGTVNVFDTNLIVLKVIKTEPGLFIDHIVIDNLTILNHKLCSWSTSSISVWNTDGSKAYSFKDYSITHELKTIGDYLVGISENEIKIWKDQTIYAAIPSPYGEIKNLEIHKDKLIVSCSKYIDAHRIFCYDFGITDEDKAYTLTDNSKNQELKTIENNTIGINKELMEKAICKDKLIIACFEGIDDLHI
ncbi:MAG: hypothetical protein JHC93_07380 [Parachlamydiales bacterium]|nr:hypothetical protein [Parachlamydiales bacterium]